jgi:hypothetical protein
MNTNRNSDLISRAIIILGTSTVLVQGQNMLSSTLIQKRAFWRLYGNWFHI